MGGRSGHFRFESGHHGDRWLDPDLLLTRPRAARAYATQLAGRLSRHAFDAVCGPLTGGAFLAVMVAEQLDLAFAFTERFAPPSSEALYPVRYRVPEALRATLSGKRVAIVNDVTNAGSAVRGTLKSLLECGAHPVALGTLLVLGAWTAEFTAAHQLALESLASRPSHLWMPAQCPLCASGVPLEDPSAAVP